MWLERLNEASEPWHHKWFSHQTRDVYWEHGSICQDFSKVKCPVLLIGGWADLYTNGVFRMVEHLSAPVRALIGPWAHIWPGDSSLGPKIDHVDVFLRWFDFHLKGIDSGIMDEPLMTVYLKEGE